MSAEPVAVRHREGTIHGFLLVRTLEGTAIATGDLVQVPHGDRINSRIVFRFKDGSIDDETTVYSQNGVFRLISDHHVQRGPSFPNPIDMSIETSTGQVTVRFTDNDGKDRVTNDHFDFPADLANGLVPTLLNNIRWDTPDLRTPFHRPFSRSLSLCVGIRRLPYNFSQEKVGQGKRNSNSPSGEPGKG